MSRTRLVIILLSLAIVGLAFLLLLVGTVHIPAGEVAASRPNVRRGISSCGRAVCR